MEKNTVVKKVYAKPGIEFVDFSLTGSIAATCTHVGTSTDGNTCSCEDNGWKFFSNLSVCDDILPEDNFCYHVPTEDLSVFNS